MAKNRNRTPVENESVVDPIVDKTDEAVVNEEVNPVNNIEPEAVNTVIVEKEGEETTESVNPVLTGDTESDSNESNIVQPSADQNNEVTPVESNKVVETTKSALTTDNNLLLDPQASLEDKIEWCLTAAPAKLKNIALQLKSYNDVMEPTAIYDEDKMLRKQYELVNIYRAVFNSETFAEFKAKFDVLNLFFNVYADGAFASHRLSRFDYLWKWSDTELETLLNVSEVVSQLCDYSNREKNLKKLNLGMALDSKKTIVSEEARNFIIKYYNK